MKEVLRKMESFFVVFLTHINVTMASKYLYFRSQRMFLDLKNPQMFNEKLMWLKLNNYNDNENVWKCSDKFLVREYALSKGVSKENLPKIIKTYENADEIDLTSLPNKFALKCSHGCGYNIICTNKSELDEDNVKKKIKKWLKKKFGYATAEIHYTHVKPRVICEEFIENENGEFPIDYKLYCFNGTPKIVLACVDRKEHYQTIFYDMEWNRLHLREKESQKELKKPSSLGEMVEIAKKLSNEFPFVRVDFYEYNGKAILGEMTFTPAACQARYTNDASLMLGDMLNIKK